MPDKCSQAPSLSNSFVTLSHMPAKGWARPGDQDEKRISRRDSPKVAPGPLGCMPSPLQLLMPLRNQPCCSWVSPTLNTLHLFSEQVPVGTRVWGTREVIQAQKGVISGRYEEESETASVDPIPHQGGGVTKGFSSDGLHQDRCLERRRPFCSKKSDITCGISFWGGVREREREEGKGEERKKERRKG